jgi:hypothetical protein
MTGQLGGGARWEQGIAENDYVKEKGIWKISRINYYLETPGPYETGWVNAGPDVKLLPFHYTPAEAGMPIPAIPANMQIPAIQGPAAAALAALNQRIQSMNDEDKIANLQNAYGYYTDRKMWDDASDLFTDDGVLEVADVGIYSGARSIRRSYERFGPQGLQYGQMNNRPIFNLLVSVSPNGAEARSRGVEFNMLGDYSAGTASLGLDVIENRYVKGADGIWRIREMRVFPIMATDYYQGWARSRLLTPPVTGPYAPDKPVPNTDRGTLTNGAIPVFFLDNPVTRKPVALPKGARVVAGDRLLPAIASAPATVKMPKDMDAAIADAERRLSLSVAYVAVDNISHALGNFIDDQQWHSLGLLMARDGWRGKAAVAFCVGPEHAEECERNYDGVVAALPRIFATGHWLIQPVIDVAPDARSAKIAIVSSTLTQPRNRPGSTTACFPTTPPSWKMVCGSSTSPRPTSLISGPRVSGTAGRARLPLRLSRETTRTPWSRSGTSPPMCHAARCRSASTVRCPATRSCGRTLSRCGLPTKIRSAVVCRPSIALTSKPARGTLRPKCTSPSTDVAHQQEIANGRIVSAHRQRRHGQIITSPRSAAWQGRVARRPDSHPADRIPYFVAAHAPVEG